MNPGFLTTEYWEGRRTRYLPPFRIYLVLSILYFFLTPLIYMDVYDNELLVRMDEGVRIPFEIHIDEYWHEIFHVYATIMNKGFMQIIDNPLTEGNLLFTYFPSAMFVVMPFMSLILFFLYRRKKLLFAHHVITVLHFNAFVFLTLIIENIVQKVLPEDALGAFAEVWIFLLFKLFIMVYLFLLLRRVYQRSWIRLSLKFIIIFIMFSIIIVLTMAALIFGKIFLLGLLAG